MTTAISRFLLGIAAVLVCGGAPRLTAQDSAPTVVASWQDKQVTCDFDNLPLSAVLVKLVAATGHPMRADPAVANNAVSFKASLLRADHAVDFVAKISDSETWIDNDALLFRPVVQRPEAPGSRDFPPDELLRHFPAQDQAVLALAQCLQRSPALLIEQPFDDAMRTIAPLFRGLGVTITIDASVTSLHWPVRLRPGEPLPLDQTLSLLGWQVGATWRVEGTAIVYSVPAKVAPLVAALDRPCPFAAAGLDVGVFSERLTKALGVKVIPMPGIMADPPKVGTPAADLPLRLVIMGIPGVKYAVQQEALVLTEAGNADLPNWITAH